MTKDSAREVERGPWCGTASKNIFGSGVSEYKYSDRHPRTQVPQKMSSTREECSEAGESTAGGRRVSVVPAPQAVGE